MTTRGRTLAALAVSMFVFGRMAGMRELLMAGSAIGLVLLIGIAFVWVRGGSATAARSIYPGRIAAGRSARVQLTVSATGRFGAGPVLLEDRIPGRIGNSVRLALGAGGGRRERTVAYTLTPRLRGRYSIGPLEITHTDPFGAARRKQTVRGTSSLVVYPAFEQITSLPSGVQRLGVIRHSPLVGQGDEFYALRPYEEGDDLRKVHWPSSIRTGEMVIRQEELLAEPRALVILDTCASKHHGRGASASIEAAISACASVGVLALRRRMRLTVLTAEGPLLDVRSNEHDLLEALAVLEPSKQRTMVGGLQRSRGRGPRPAITVLITPGMTTEEIRTTALVIRGTAGGAVVYIDAPSFTPSAPQRRKGPGTLADLTFPVLVLGARDSFRVRWQGGVKGAALAR